MLKRFACVMLLALSLPAQAEDAPSFDCDKAATPVEKLICQSPELAQLDAGMSVLHKPGGGKWLARIHARWLARRNACGDVACLTASYQGHNEKLESLQFLDWNNELSLMAVLDIAKDQDAVRADQQAWRKLLDRCGDPACAERAFAQRELALAALLKQVPRAGMKKYVNKAMGIGFDYLENRSIEPCGAAPDCIRLKGAAMGADSAAILEIQVQQGSLNEVADMIWVRRGATWFASGRFSEAQVEPYSDGWTGLQATTMCSLRGRHGDHAAGECNTYLHSNGKRAVLIRDDANNGKDPASLATVSSMHFLP